MQQPKITIRGGAGSTQHIEIEMENGDYIKIAVRQNNLIINAQCDRNDMVTKQITSNEFRVALIELPQIK